LDGGLRGGGGRGGCGRLVGVMGRRGEAFGYGVKGERVSGGRSGSGNAERRGTGKRGRK